MNPVYFRIVGAADFINSLKALIPLAGVSAFLVRQVLGVAAAQSKVP